MSSSVPTIQQFSWTGILLQLITIAILSLGFYFIGIGRNLEGINGILISIICGAAVQLILWLIINNTYAKFHNHGMDLVKQEKYADAIPFFVKSYENFLEHAWVDKYRHIFAHNSKMTYKEMDLNNIAFCYAQIGEKEKSIEYYKRLLSEYPNNGLAKAALNMIETMTGNCK